MMSSEATLKDVASDVWIADGRVQMQAGGDAKAMLKTPDQQPLSASEPEFVLFLSGDDFEATVTLTIDQADTLRGVLEGDQDGEGE